MTISTLICFVGLSVALCATNFGADSLDVVSNPAQPTPRSFGDSGDMELSSDGKWTVFASSGNGIVTNKHNGFYVDIFQRNNETGEITLHSGDNSVPGGLADSDSYGPRISGDGRYVVFESDASNLVAGDDNDSTDAFIYDRTTGELKLLSVDDEGYALQGTSGAPIISV
ncbi:MAG TPA: hypothetical protein VM735_11220, partial [Candidatus Kapabacteria bacterium]|nr:hypothetical protein [Candidatus Kapabacteria bacterium]